MTDRKVTTEEMLVWADATAGLASSEDAPKFYDREYVAIRTLIRLAPLYEDLEKAVMSDTGVYRGSRNTMDALAALAKAKEEMK